MKLFLFLFTILIFPCCSKHLNKTSILAGHTFENQKGYSYDPDKLIFNLDSTFTFYKQGPFVLISVGSWRYDKLSRMISFNSKNPDSAFTKISTIDTLWTDLSNRKARLVSNREIIFDNIQYLRK